MDKLEEKYRPAALADIIGQDKAIKIISRLEPNIGGRAYWITGQSGTGKTTIAKILALMVADPLYTVETTGRGLTPTILNDFRNKWPYTALFGRGGHALIVNEAHGMTKPVIEILLDILEEMPNKAVVIFTTTRDGAELFEEQMDSSPFKSRCISLILASRGLAEPFAAKVKAIAQAENLDGKPIEAYISLMKECRNNFRAALQAVQSGRMIE